MRRATYCMMACLVFAVVPAIKSQTDATAEIQKKLTQQFSVTKFTSDKTGIVGNAGSVLVLQKDNLLVYSASVAAAPMNTYKNGKFSQGFGDMLAVDLTDGLGRQGGSSSIPRKKLVAGEKFWLAGATVSKDKVVFAVITDPYDDGRYFAQIKFQFPKGPPPSPDDLMKMISEVVTIQPADNAQQAAPGPVGAPGLAPEQALAPIPPPPPPADAPPPPTRTISLGQTKDQVVNIFGNPQKVVQAGTKEIDVYPDMKVTFVDGKVSDVQ